MKISPRSLRARAIKLGFVVKRTEVDTYQLVASGDHGPAAEGDFNDVRQWLLGLEYERQQAQQAKPTVKS